MNNKSQGWLTTLFGWGRRRQSTEAENLYASAVAVARRPIFYQKFGIKDTVDGRFDTLSLVVVLIMRKLKDCGHEGKEISQELFDSMFADMDLSLREMGAGDIGVSKRVRIMAEAFMGRLGVYADALDNLDRVALAAALQRNLFRDDVSIDSMKNGSVDYVFALASEIANLSPHRLIHGNLDLT